MSSPHADARVGDETHLARSVLNGRPDEPHDHVHKAGGRANELRQRQSEQRPGVCNDTQTRVTTRAGANSAFASRRQMTARPSRSHAPRCSSERFSVTPMDARVRLSTSGSSPSTCE